MSAGQIDGFAKFSEPYLEYAFNYFDGKDVRNGSLSAGVNEYNSPELKERFCVQMLARTDLSASMKVTCKGAKIKSGDVVLKFDDYVNENHKTRSCAYYNFSQQEKRSQEKMTWSSGK